MWKSIGLVLALSVAAFGQDVDTLRGELAHVDATTRANAARRLGAAGDDARAALPELVDALEDRASAVRMAAIESLGRIRLPDAGLGDSLRGMRVWGALGSIAASERATEATLALTALLRLRGSATIEEAATLLVVELAASPDAQERVRAAVLDAGNDAVPMLLRMTHDAAWRRRVHAVELLGAVGAADDASVARLAALARDDPFEMVRDVALATLSSSAPESEGARALLRNALRGADEIARAAALEALLRDAGVARNPEPALRAALSDESGAVRLYALRVARTLGVGPDVLVAALRDSDPEIVAEAARALHETGADARLVEHAGEPSLARLPVVAAACAHAGVRTTHAAGVLARTAVLGHDEAWRMKMTADAREQGGDPRDEDPISLATSRTEMPGARTRPWLPSLRPLPLDAVVAALAATGPAGAAALAAQLGDPDATVRALSAYALGRLGAEEVHAAAERLRGGLEDNDPRVRLAAAGALASHGEPPPVVLPALVDGFLAAGRAEGAEHARVSIETWRLTLRRPLERVLDGMAHGDVDDLATRQALQRLVDQLALGFTSDWEHLLVRAAELLRGN